MQNPRVIGIDIKRELIVSAHRARVRGPNPVDDRLQILQIPRARLPSRVLYPAAANVFFQEAVVGIGPIVSRPNAGYRDGHREEKKEPE